MYYTDAIVELKNIIDPVFAKRIINITKARSKKNLKVRDGLIQNIRDVKGHHLNFDTPTNLFYWNYIKEEIQRLYLHYKIKFPKMSSYKINQIDLLKYEPGNKYEIHTDHYTDAPRHLSIILNLNQDYEGGDLVFTDQKENEVKRLKLKERTIVFFPSNFMYPHTIEPITKGTRYSIVAWLQ